MKNARRVQRAKPREPTQDPPFSPGGIRKPLGAVPPSLKTNSIMSSSGSPPAGNVRRVLISGRSAAWTGVVDLPSAILRDADFQNVPHEVIKGVLHEGHIYLVRENLEDARDAELTIFHEAYGHLGARLFLGPDIVAVRKAFVTL